MEFRAQGLGGMESGVGLSAQSSACRRGGGGGGGGRLK